MSDFLTDFYTELSTLLTSTLDIPTPVSGNVNMVTTIQTQQHNFVEMLNARSGSGWKFSLPGVIVSTGDLIEKRDELSMNSVGLMRMPITIIYVASLGEGDTQSFMYSQILKLKKAIDSRPSTFNTFTRIEEGKILTSVDCPINSTLMSDSQVGVIASALVYSPGLLVQEY